MAKKTVAKKEVASKKKEDKKSITDTVKELKKKFGPEAVMMLNQKPLVGVDSLSTGSFGLDEALGIGGYPKGRIIEIFGPESSGKTTLALHAVAEAQKLGEICAYIDTEHAMNPEYAKKLGVDTSSLMISQPSNGEEAFEICEAMIATGKVKLVVIDSVAYLTPKAEIEGQTGDAFVGRMPKLIGHGLRKVVPLAEKNKATIIFINQIRMMIGQMYGNPEITPGGKSLKFATSVRIEIRKIASIKKGEQVMGARTRIKVVKNKVAVPFKQVEVDILYGEGISKETEILAMGEKMGIITRSGATYNFGDEKIGRGYDSARRFLKENPQKFEEIVKDIKEYIKKQEDVQPNEAEEEKPLETNTEEI